MSIFTPAALLTVGPNFGSVTVDGTNNNGIIGNNGIVSVVSLDVIQADNTNVRHNIFLENKGLQYSDAIPIAGQFHILTAKYGYINNATSINVTNQLQRLFDTATINITQPIYISYDTTGQYKIYVINTAVFSSIFGQLSVSVQTQLDFTMQYIINTGFVSNLLLENSTGSVGSNRGGISYSGTGTAIQANAAINQNFFGFRSTSKRDIFLEAQGDQTFIIPTGYLFSQVISATYESINGSTVLDVSDIILNAFTGGPSEPLMTKLTSSQGDILYIVHTNNFNEAFTDIDYGIVKVLKWNISLGIVHHGGLL